MFFASIITKRLKTFFASATEVNDWKENVLKTDQHYKKTYKLNALDIFADKDVEIGDDEKIIKVKILPYEKD